MDDNLQSFNRTPRTMTVSSDNRKAGPFNGNGIVATFPYAFVVFSTDDLLVIHTDAAGVESPLTMGSGYTATMNPDQNSNPGGDVTLPAPLPTGEKITITSILGYLQTLDLTNLGGFYPDVIERALDRVVVLCQQNAEQLSRTIKIGISDSTPADQYRDSLLKASADAIAAASSAQASQGAAATSEANAGSSAAAALASQNAAATSETNAAASETAALTSQTAAAVSEGNAANSATAATTAANSASDSANAAGLSKVAAATSETNAASSEANAAGSAADAQAAAALAAAIPAAAPWMSMPIGVPFPLDPDAPPPPTNDPNYRYIVLTAGLTGAGQYNAGVLTGETVTGSTPLVVATAVVSLAGSPKDGKAVHLINTEGRFVGAGVSESFEDDSLQGHKHGQAAGQSGNGSGLSGRYADGSQYVDDSGLVTTDPKTDGVNGTPRVADHTQPRAHRLPHYMRIK